MTLFGVHPDDLKDCVYDMRFDEASALYAEFGPFYTGMVGDARRGAGGQLGPGDARPASTGAPRRPPRRAAPARAGRGRLQRRRRLGASWPGWRTTPSAAAVLCVTAVSPSLAPEEARLPGAGRRVGPALGGRPHRRDRRPRLRGQRPRPLLPLQGGADGRCSGPLAAAEAATVVLGVNLDDLGDHRPASGAAAGRGRLPAGRGRLHQGRHPALVPRPWPADLGQAGRRLPGLAAALRHPGHPRALAAVGPAESALRALGFGQLRVRHHGDAARLEFEPLPTWRRSSARRDEVVRGRAAARVHASWRSTSRGSAPGASTGCCGAGADGGGSR